MSCATVYAACDIGVHVAGTGPFLITGYELALAPSAQVDTTHNTIANRVLLQGAKIGDVQTNTLTVQNGGTYTKKYAFPTTMPALPGLAPVFAGTTALTVNASTTVAVAPGAFGAVAIGTQGILRLCRTLPGSTSHTPTTLTEISPRRSTRLAIVC